MYKNSLYRHVFIAKKFIMLYKKIFNTILIAILFAACSTPKTYFTAAIRSQLAANHQPLDKIQFYNDRNIVLRRDVKTGEAKVNDGKVVLENGRNVNIITLKKNTPGVCVLQRNNIVGIAFEQDNNNFITFGKTKQARPNDPYRILANEWINEYGVINYDGQLYHIEPAGTEASIMIKSKILRKLNISQREMKGRKVNDNDMSNHTATENK